MESLVHQLNVNFQACMHALNTSVGCTSKKGFVPSYSTGRFVASSMPYNIHQAHGETEFSSRTGFSVRNGSSIRAAQNLISSEISTSGYSSDVEVDVAIIGAGIIGLSVAYCLLDTTSLSVALMDAKQPCAGATGAGQGYIWMAHRQPGTASWALANRSKDLWEALHEELPHGAPGSLGWKNTGSMLVGNSPEEAAGLKQRVAGLMAAGIEAHYLDATCARAEEPQLGLCDEGGAALVPGDSQLDAELAVSVLLERCREFGRGGRFHQLFHEAVESILRSKDGEVVGVQTQATRVGVRCGAVLAAGPWSGVLMERLTGPEDGLVVPRVTPRKGHLLVLEGLPQIQLKRALMEAEYNKFYQVLPPVSLEGSSSASSGQSEPMAGGQAVGRVSEASSDVAVSMTATMDAAGHLLIGSSREFCGFSTGVAQQTLDAILARAAEFLPSLTGLAAVDALRSGRVRTGLRPYVPDGKPLIGPVPGVPRLLLATGHEGSGLCMAPGTAEIVRSMLLGEQPLLDVTSFLPAGRLSLSKSLP